MIQKNLEMREKRGPTWESWKKGMTRFLEEDKIRAEELTRERSRKKRLMTRGKSKKPLRKRKR
ncbi:hypothetical protein ES703_79954 [subsurface metagenome]